MYAYAAKGKFKFPGLRTNFNSPTRNETPGEQSTSLCGESGLRVPERNLWHSWLNQIAAVLRVSAAVELVSAAVELVSAAVELVSAAVELVSAAVELVSGAVLVSGAESVSGAVSVFSLGIAMTDRGVLGLTECYFQSNI
jgi:hypothetical protein